MFVSRIAWKQTYKCCRQSALAGAGFSQNADQLGGTYFKAGLVQSTNCRIALQFVGHRQLVNEDHRLVGSLSGKSHSCAQVDHKASPQQPQEDYGGTFENTRTTRGIRYRAGTSSIG